MLQIKEKTYCYIFVRTDLSLQQQMVQSNHATLEVGLKDQNSYAEPSSIVLCQLDNQEELLQELAKLMANGIDCAEFYEPYEDIGYTAFATKPITESQRHLFANYTLWGKVRNGIKTPLNQFVKDEMKQIQRDKQFKINQERLVA